MIEGVLTTALRQIPDERGAVMHMLRVDKAPFSQFGEVYFSCINDRAVKAWRRHQRMTVNLTVVAGAVRIVVFDARPGSRTTGQFEEAVVSPQTNYVLITIPPAIWYGFRGEAPGTSVIANCATLPHDPTEVERLADDDAQIPYSWD